MENIGIIFELIAMIMILAGIGYIMETFRQSFEKKADGIISALKEIQQELAKKD